MKIEDKPYVDRRHRLSGKIELIDDFAVVELEYPLSEQLLTSSSWRALAHVNIFRPHFLIKKLNSSSFHVEHHQQ